MKPLRALSAIALLSAVAPLRAQGPAEGGAADRALVQDVRAPAAQDLQRARLALSAADVPLDLPAGRLDALAAFRGELAALAAEAGTGDEAARAALAALIRSTDALLTPRQWASVSIAVERSAGVEGRGKRAVERALATAQALLASSGARGSLVAGSGFGEGPNHSSEAHRAANRAIEAALTAPATGRDESADKALVARSLQPVARKFGRKRVRVPGLGIVALRDGLSALKRVVPIRGDPTVRYASEKDFQVSHVGLGGEARRHALGTIYLDSALLTSKALTGVLAHDVALLAFRVAAKAKGLAWSPALARGAHDKALDLARMIAPAFAGAVSRRLDLLKARRYRFETGVEILATGGLEPRLYVRRPGEEPELLGEGQVTFFPVAGRKPGRHEYGANPDHKKQLVVHLQEAVWLVTSDGRAVRFPLGASRLARREDGSFKYEVSDVFVYGGKAHKLFSFASRGPGAKGETFLAREDGVLVRVDNRFREFPAIEKQVRREDGMLVLSGRARPIDLDRLEAEMRFEPRLAKPVVDSEGAAIRDPLQYVETRFENISREMRRNPNAAFELIRDPEEDALIKKMRQTLIKPELGSTVLLGPAGVAKTQTVRSFIAAAARGEFPEIPRTTRFFNIDAATFGQGSGNLGSDESKIKALIEACAQVPCVLVMDEIHSLRGQGTHSRNGNDLFQHLKTAMADGSIKIIGTSTDDEFYAAFGGDSALLRRFGIVRKAEPSTEKVLKIARSWIKRFRKRPVSDDVLRLLIRLSSDYDAAGAQPSKATKLLSHAFAMREVDGKAQEEFTEATAKEAAADLYGVAPEMFDLELAGERLRRLPDALDKRVPGQAWAKTALVELERQHLASAHDPRRPALSVILAGSREADLGVAFGDATGRPVRPIDMSRYASGGLSPEDFRREMARAVQKNAFTVLLLEQFEQADPMVQLAALAILDSGETSVQENLNSSADGSGGATVRYSFRNAAILMTTNAGREFVQRQTRASGPGKDRWHELRDAVEKGGVFGSVLDHVQAVVASVPATTKELKTILRFHLERVLAEQTYRQGRRVLFPNQDDLLTLLASRGGEDGAGERDVLEMERFVRSAVADVVLDARSEASGPIEIRFDRDRFETSRLAHPPRN